MIMHPLQPSVPILAQARWSVLRRTTGHKDGVRRYSDPYACRLQALSSAGARPPNQSSILMQFNRFVCMPSFMRRPIWRLLYRHTPCRSIASALAASASGESLSLCARVLSAPPATKRKRPQTFCNDLKSTGRCRKLGDFFLSPRSWIRPHKD